MPHIVRDLEDAGLPVLGLHTLLEYSLPEDGLRPRALQDLRLQAHVLQLVDPTALHLEPRQVRGLGRTEEGRESY